MSRTTAVLLLVLSVAIAGSAVWVLRGNVVRAPHSQANLVQGVDPTETQPFYEDETPVFPNPWPTSTQGPLETATPPATEETVFPGQTDIEIVEAIRLLTQEEHPATTVTVLQYADLLPSDGGGPLPPAEKIADAALPDIAILMSGTFNFHGSSGSRSFPYMIATVDRIYGRYSDPTFYDLASAQSAMPQP